MRSGADDITLQRGLTSGKQNFETDESLWPVSQPIEKVEAKWQTAGEAEYIGDIPERKDELHGAFVLSSLANATVVRVDSTKALAMPGVVTFIDAQNVPGVNNWKFSETVSEIYICEVSGNLSLLWGIGRGDLLHWHKQICRPIAGSGHCRIKVLICK